MAKKALISKASRKPKFAVRAYTRCRRCGESLSSAWTETIAIAGCAFAPSAS